MKNAFCEYEHIHQQVFIPRFHENWMLPGVRIKIWHVFIFFQGKLKPLKCLSLIDFLQKYLNLTDFLGSYHYLYNIEIYYHEN